MFKLVNDAVGRGSDIFVMQVFLCVIHECGIFCQVFSAGLILLQMGAKKKKILGKWKNIDTEFSYCKKTFPWGFLLKLFRDSCLTSVLSEPVNGTNNSWRKANEANIGQSKILKQTNKNQTKKQKKPAGEWEVNRDFEHLQYILGNLMDALIYRSGSCSVRAREDPKLITDWHLFSAQGGSEDQGLVENCPNLHTEPWGDDWETHSPRHLRESACSLMEHKASQAETSVTTHHKECRHSLTGIGNALTKHIAMATHCGDDCENTEDPWIIHFKMVNFMICELQLRKPRSS